MKKAAGHSEREEMGIGELLLYGLGGAAVLGGLTWTGFHFYKKWAANQEEKKSFKDGDPATIAKAILMALENDTVFGWGTDTNALREALQSVPDKEVWEAVRKSFKRQTGKEIEAALKEDLQSSEYQEMLQIIAGKPTRAGAGVSSDKYRFWAKRFKAAFDKTYGFLPGTDEDAIRAIFTEMPNRAAFAHVKQAYYELYTRDLEQDLKDESEFGEYSEYMEMFNKKG